MKRSARFVVGVLVLMLLSEGTASLAGGPGKSDAEGRVLSRVTFIHFRRAPAKPPWAGGGGGGDKKPKDDGHYAFIVNGTRWRVLENVVVNTTNSEGLSAAEIEEAIAAGLTEWETYGGQIFGDLVTDDTAYYDDSTTDNVNT
ncbi:hypothetical protein HQ576_06695, partial [bacterium]|nr:hypothetical protein [bacterium]